MADEISFVATVLPIFAFILAKLHTLGIQARLKHNIKLVLGSGVKSAEDIVFSLPVWTPLKDGDRSARYNKPIEYKTATGGVPNHLHGPDATYARSDVESAIRLSSVIAKELKEPVEIIPDSTPLEEMHNKSYFFIGAPTVNSHANALFTNPKRAGKLAIVTTEENAETRESFYFLNRQDNQKYRTDEECGYALIVRHTHDRFHCFYVFGQHESGTKAAAKYFIDNFYSLRYYTGDFEILLKVRKSLVFCDYEIAVAPETTPPSLFNRTLDRIFNARQIS